MVSEVNADTIYFKNGRSVEGIIKEETNKTVEIDMGFGTITCGRDEIAKIEASTPEERDAISAKWEHKRKDLQAKEGEFALDRQRRGSEYQRWVREEQEKKKQGDADKREIRVMRDPESKSILADVLLNGKVKATLVLDTGASVVVLSKKIGLELGIKLDETQKNDIMELHLAGDRRVNARMVAIKTVEIGDAEAKDVLAGVLLEDFVNPGFKDGLLGMTFLNRFNFKIDLKEMKLSLEKLKS